MLGLLLLACAPSSPPPPRTVVVVSWDTTRADALGCYEDVSHWGRNIPMDLRPAPKTPVADGLAAQGVRFQWALSGAPTTLNSHTSLFSGLDPHQHRVVRNGYPVPDDVPLLAEALQSRGWQTLAVVGSSALEASMGLARGFDGYDDPGAQPVGGMYMRDAALVTERTLALIDAQHTTPQDLFVFVHYYDPHTPWMHPVDPEIGVPGYSGRVDGSMPSIEYLTTQRRSQRMLIDDVRQARALYLSQVAWADAQTGALLAGLQQRGLMDNALVVLLSDHGESLDEHGRFPYSHGPDVDLMNIHVPLIFQGTGTLQVPAGAVVRRQVRLMDVGTSLLQLLEPDAPILGFGEQIAPLWLGANPPSPPAFAEATKPISMEHQRGWNNLPFERAVIFDGRVVVKSPWQQQGAELYQLAPGQPPLDDPGAQAYLDGLLQAWDAGAPPFRESRMSAETEAALQSLGYLDAPPAPAPVDGAEPTHAD